MIKLRIYGHRLAMAFIFSFLGLQMTAAERDSLFLSVGQLLEKGVENSLKLKADKIQEQMACERTKTARAARLPDLRIGLDGGFAGRPTVFKHGLRKPEHPDAPDWSQNYAVNLSQPLYQGGKIRHSIRKADLDKEAASLQATVDNADVKLNLLEQYLGLFNLYRKQHVLRQNVEESERRLKDIRGLRREGLITDNDVLRSEMQLTADRLSLQQTDNDIELASQQLDILIGMDERLLIVPDTTLLHQTFTLASYDTYVDKSYGGSPDMRLLRKQTEAAEAEVKLTRAQSMPDVSLYASNTLARPISRTLEDLYNNNWNIGLSVSVPLSSFYKNNHRVKESKMAVEIRRNDEDLMMQNIRVYVRTAWLRHREAIQRVKSLELSVRQAEENYRIMRNRYFNQMVILTDLLDASSMRLDAELQLTTARTSVIYTYYQLQRACGQL